MNTLLHLLFLCVGLTFVICDQNAEIQCMKDGTKALEGKTDDELYNLTQENLKIGIEMVAKRVAVANANGLTCYKQFYHKYVETLSSILLTGEKARLDKAKTPEERKGAIKGLAGLTQAMRCDEKWRAENLDANIKATVCPNPEQGISVAKLLNFHTKLAGLKSGLFLGTNGLKLSNNVMSGVVGELLSMFSNLYAEGEKCSKSQSTAALKCSNMNSFVQELDRLFELVKISAMSKA